MKKYLDDLKIPYRDLKYYERAMIHPSYQNEKGLAESNQRMEFLGDAVIELIVSNYLFLKLGAGEGELSRLRATIVCEEALAKLAKRIGLQNYLLLGRGEEALGGRERSSTISDAFEAFMAAIFLDLGLDGARDFFLDNFSRDMDGFSSGKGFVDYKSRLQIRCQRENKNISYRVLETSGPDHKKLFTLGLYIDGKLISTGRGSSKREAEQRAAQEALNEGL